MIQMTIGLVLQILFLFMIGRTVQIIDRRFFHEDSIAVRWLAASVIFCWIISIIYSVLIPFGLFKPLPAVLSAAFVLMLTKKKFAKPFICTEENLQKPSPEEHLLELFRENLPLKIISTVLIFFTIFHTLFGLTLPILAWDTLTYHGLKSASWVQTGGWLLLDAPGAWESYRSFFGGGEVYSAWAMLFLRSDALMTVPDLFFWLLTILVTSCLGFQSGLKKTTAFAVACAMVCNCEFHRWVNC